LKPIALLLCGYYQNFVEVILINTICKKDANKLFAGIKEARTKGPCFRKNLENRLIFKEVSIKNKNKPARTSNLLQAGLPKSVTLIREYVKFNKTVNKNHTTSLSLS